MSCNITDVVNSVCLRILRCSELNRTCLIKACIPTVSDSTQNRLPFEAPVCHLCFFFFSVQIDFTLLPVHLQLLSIYWSEVNCHVIK